MSVILVEPDVSIVHLLPSFLVHRSARSLPAPLNGAWVAKGGRGRSRKNSLPPKLLVPCLAQNSVEMTENCPAARPEALKAA